jgi:hypothetical protein
LRAVAKLDGKGFCPKNAVDPSRDRRGVVNETTAFRGHLGCAQGLRLLACQGAFSHNSFQKNGNRIADCSFVNNKTTLTHNDMEAN